MNLWDFLNSPLVITVVSFALGGLLVAFVTARLQQRAQRHSVRLAITQQLLDVYHEYIRHLRGPIESNNEADFDRVHAELMSRSRITKVLFGKSTSHELERLANRLANVQQLRKTGQHSHVPVKLSEAYRHAEQIFESMFQELDIYQTPFLKYQNSKYGD